MSSEPREFGQVANEDLLTKVANAGARHGAICQVCMGKGWRQGCAVGYGLNRVCNDIAAVHQAEREMIYRGVLDPFPPPAKLEAAK